MARKKPLNRPPRVPRSNIRESAIRRAAPKKEAPVAASTAAAASSPAPARYVPEPPTLEEQYAHVKKDLVRITIFGTLIFAGMFALKFMGI